MSGSRCSRPDCCASNGPREDGLKTMPRWYFFIVVCRFPGSRRNMKTDLSLCATDSLLLRYREESGRFSGENLSITRGDGAEVNPAVWYPGLKDSANLHGTTRTLDGVKGATDLEPGLLSRDGMVRG